jgi:hypothetical protein
MEYVTDDLIRVYVRACERGPKAVALFRQRVEQAFERYRTGDSGSLLATK